MRSSQKRGMLEREVAPRLLELAGKRQHLLGSFERLAVEGRKIAQQHTGLCRVGPDERGDRVERIEEEVRIDLGLEGLDLGTCRKLCLKIQLIGRELRREKVGKSSGNRDLRAVDRPSVAVVERDGAYRLSLHDERGNDAGREDLALLDAPLLLEPADLGARVLEGLESPRLQGLCDAGRILASRRVGCGILADIGQDLLRVAHGDGLGGRLREQQLADSLAGVRGKAVAHVVKRVRGNAQGTLGRTRTQAIRIDEGKACQHHDDSEGGPHQACRHGALDRDAPAEHNHQGDNDKEEDQGKEQDEAPASVLFVHPACPSLMLECLLTGPSLRGPHHPRAMP
jgi:hypothetical protein